MSEKEAKEIIQSIPIGSRLQLLKKTGEVFDVVLASHDTSGTEKKDYGTIVVPALPPALTVQGGTRFGSFRVELEDLVKIAWVD